MTNLVGRLIAAACALLLSMPLWADDSGDPSLYEQRQAYRRAVDHLRTGRVSAAREIQQELSGYVLAPYLTYHRNRMRLSALTAAEVQSFRQAHPDLPGAQRIYWQWLEQQADRGHWRTFLKHYESTDSAELQCHRLRALHLTGEKEAALDGVPPLWTVGESQPKACDPIFQVWQKERLTDEVAWERLRLAIDANERQLARYLIRFFSSSHRHWAQAYYDVHVSPNHIKSAARYRTDNPLSRQVIAHGLKRLAARDPEAAGNAWAQYRESHSFPAAERRHINGLVEAALAGAGLLDRAPEAEASPEAAADFAKAYVRQRKWALLSAWIERMPEDERVKENWQYWLARAVDETHDNSERARRAYLSLAENRSYYGFLAALHGGGAINMNEAGKPTAAERQQALEIPSVARAIELFAVGDEVNARRELAHILPRLAPRERRAAVYWVQSIGYPILTIHTANRAELRDDLALRFPILHRPLFERGSHNTDVPLPVLLAFARQESAFAAKAKSVANARGVLQMLPSTARLAAKRAGLPQPAANDLYDPAVNIPLGSHHIAWLLRRYNGSLPLAAAGYNAGEHRADRWAKELAGAPMDVWIESIPFRETRNYVKNVLAFALVYAHRLGEPPPSLGVVGVRVP